MAWVLVAAAAGANPRRCRPLHCLTSTWSGCSVAAGESCGTRDLRVAVIVVIVVVVVGLTSRRAPCRSCVWWEVEMLSTNMAMDMATTEITVMVAMAPAVVIVVVVLLLLVVVLLLPRVLLLVLLPRVRRQAGPRVASSGCVSHGGGRRRRV